jgi:hypothetical protein
LIPLLKASLVQPFVYQFTLFQGKPDRAMAKLCVALPLEGIVLGTSAGWWRQEVVWCLSSASMTPSIGGMAQQCLQCLRFSYFAVYFEIATLFKHVNYVNVGTDASI